MREFIGFGGVVLTADVYGNQDHPCVVLLPGITQTRKVWVSAAKALAQAGRYVISLDLRGHGGSDSPKDCNYSLEAFMGDLVAVLAQLESRPVVVGSNFGGWIGLAALGNTSAPIATGLVLTNPPPEFQSLNNESIAKQSASEHPVRILIKVCLQVALILLNCKTNLSPQPRA